jgi:probable addiction module antidote protein
MSIKTRPWDAANHLRTKDEIAYYLEAVLEDGDTDLLSDALGAVARTAVAKEAGLPALPDDVVTALGIVIKTLGIRLSATREAQAAE